MYDIEKSRIDDKILQEKKTLHYWSYWAGMNHFHRIIPRIADHPQFKRYCARQYANNHTKESFRIHWYPHCRLSYNRFFNQYQCYTPYEPSKPGWGDNPRAAYKNALQLIRWEKLDLQSQRKIVAQFSAPRGINPGGDSYHEDDPLDQWIQCANPLFDGDI